MTSAEWDAFQIDGAEALRLLAYHGYVFTWQGRHKGTGYVVVEPAGGLFPLVLKTRPELSAFKAGWMAARWAVGEAIALPTPSGEQV